MASVAVLVPVYNREQYIQACLKSMLVQTHKDLVVLVYDDGSTDQTFNKIITLNDHKIIYHKCEQNNGVVVARNWLLNTARDMNIKYACWQDSDDLSHPKRVAKQLEFIEKTGQPMVLGGWAAFYGDAAPKFNIRPKRASNDVIIFASAFFDPKSVPDFEEIRREPTPTTLGGEDVVWRERLLQLHGEPREVRDELYYVRRHADRIGVWRKNPKANPDWYKRMDRRVT